MLVEAIAITSKQFCLMNRSSDRQQVISITRGTMMIGAKYYYWYGIIGAF